MTNSRFFAGILLFSAMVAVGYVAGLRSWNGVVYLTEGTIANNWRNPAAIKRDLDFSKLDGAELITATQKRLVEAARTRIREDFVGVELGHFIVRDGDGQKRLACENAYNRLTLIFEAEGIASAGEKPVLEINAPCKSPEREISTIEPVWIPVAKFLSGRAVNTEVEETSEGVKFKFSNMTGTWPVMWRLQSVRLFNDKETSTREVLINSKELREIRPKPFVMNWLEARRKSP